MSRRTEFVEFVLEQMSSVGGLHARAMFGGHGIYRDDLIFAIVVDDRLYFKTDAMTRPEFEAMGSRPFSYVARGKPVTMQYFEAPPEVLEERETMRSWVDKAFGAARRTGKARTSDN